MLLSYLGAALHLPAGRVVQRVYTETWPVAACLVSLPARGLCVAAGAVVKAHAGGRAFARENVALFMC